MDVSQRIKRAIFQGDSLSPLLFCLALVPLTSELATSGYGYKISSTSAPISNLFYMDDLKLYSKNEQEQIGELKIVKQFSDDIGMEFGLEKCAKAIFKKGKLTSTGNIVIDVDTEIQELDQEGVFKYLGVDELNGRNKMEAINSLAVPVVQYSFGIIDWKISELKKIDTKTRKLLNMHKMLHPKADVDRLYLPRRDAGRGLIEVETAFKTATIGLDPYLKHKERCYPKQLLEHDRSKAINSITKNATKFKREITMPEFENREDKSASENAKALKHIFKSTMKSMKEEKWKDKALRGQYPKMLEKPHVDTFTTDKWLSSNLKEETEGLLVATQDQAINTRNYQKVICGQQVESKCRMCSQQEETVDHIVSGCEVLAKTEYMYISRHNNAAAYLHWSICKDHDLKITDKWYQHTPETVIHNKDNNLTKMWDMPVNTDGTAITANRPDITVKDSVNSTCKLIDITVPSDRNIALKEIEKKSKYKDLELEIQRMWHMKTIVIPVVVGALGTVKKGMIENIEKVSKRANVTELQKICMLGSARILRKVLSI